MNKKLFLSLCCVFSILCVTAQSLEENKAFQLNVNNGDAYLDCGNIAELNEAAQYTIEMWVNVTLSELPDRFVMFKKEQSDEVNRIKIQVEKNGQIYIMQSNGGDGAFAQTAAGAYPESGWHHIALVYDGAKGTSDEGAMILYIDGVRQSISNATFKSTTGNIDAPFALGGPALNVKYDEVKVWNKALSAATIMEWKDYKVLDSHPERESLVAYYDFQKVSGNTVSDEAENYPALFDETEAAVVNAGFAISEEQPTPIAVNNGFRLNVNNGDAYLDCGNIAELNEAAQYTIEMWVNVTLSELPDRFVMFKKEQSDEVNRIKIQVEKNGQIYIMQSNGGDGAFAQTAAGAYPESGWHHIALVYDGAKGTSDEGAMILYIDGVRQLISNATFKSTTGNIDAPFAVGGPALNVEYDEIRIWNKVLSETVINEWVSYRLNDSHPEKESLVAYYDFEDVSDNQVADRQGNYPATFKSGEGEIRLNDLQLFEKENLPTAIEERQAHSDCTLQIITAGGEVRLKGLVSQTVSVYNLSGALVRTLQIDKDEEVTLSDLPRGFYIVNRQKIIIK